MKTILYIFLLFTASTFAQTYQSIEPIEEKGESEYGIYYKDVNNVFNSFEGTYEYIGTDFYFKIILQKKVLSNANNYYWQDMIVGGYKYVNATLNINVDYLDEAINSLGMPDGRNCKLTLSSIRAPEPDFCPDCPSEKWLIGTIYDPIQHKSAWLYIAKKTQNGEPGIYIAFHLEAATKQPWESDEPIQLPIGEFFMKKVN